MDFATDSVGIGAMHPSLFMDNSTYDSLLPRPQSLLSHGHKQYASEHQPELPTSYSNLCIADQPAYTAAKFERDYTAATFDRRLSWLDISNGYQANEYMFLTVKLLNGETRMFTLGDPEQYHQVESVVTGHVGEKIVGWIASKERFNLDTSTHGIKHREDTSKTKRKPKRTIDESRAIEPTVDDVLFGRGGYCNTHPGNIRFRETALELRPWYERCCSKEEKYHLSEHQGQGTSFLREGFGWVVARGDWKWSEEKGESGSERACHEREEETSHFFTPSATRGVSSHSVNQW